MSLNEDDKDILIKALCRALTLHEENKRLKKFIRDKMGIDVESKKSKPANTPKNRARESQKTIDAIKGDTSQSPHTYEGHHDLKEVKSSNLGVWDELTDGEFDERLNDMMSDMKVDEKDDKGEGEEDE